MGQILPLEAYRRSRQRQLGLFESRHQTVHRLVRGAEVWAILQQVQPCMWTAALALQWSLAARFCDLELLQRHHVQFRGEEILFVLVGGKTDRSGAGQGMLAPRAGPFIAYFLKYLAATLLASRRGGKELGGAVFPRIRRQTYNQFLLPTLGLISHYVRHSALTEVAEGVGGQAATGVARHASPRSTQAYTPLHTHLPTQATREGLRVLQVL